MAHRQENMSLPGNMLWQDRDTIYTILQQLQEMMKNTNPYVKDFRMICKIPEEDLLDGNLVINAKAWPAD